MVEAINECGLKQLPQAINECMSEGKVPILLDTTGNVGTFFSYSGVLLELSKMTIGMLAQKTTKEEV